MLCSNASLQLIHTPLQACNFTDHDLISTTVPMRPAGAHPPRHTDDSPTASPANASDSSAQPQSTTTYRWVEGTCLKEYGTSAVTWKRHTATPEFEAKFETILQTHAEDNDLRSAQVEAFLLAEAISAGVLTATVKRTSLNPNRWEKHLAPWFTSTCRAARASYRAAVRHNGKTHSHTVHALKRYSQACKDGRAQMQFQLPEMLKQRPK